MMPFRDRQIVVHARAKYYWLCWLHYSNALFVTRPRQRAIFAAFSWSLRECGYVRTGGREREVGRGTWVAGVRAGGGTWVGLTRQQKIQKEPIREEVMPSKKESPLGRDSPEINSRSASSRDARTSTMTNERPSVEGRLKAYREQLTQREPAAPVRNRTKAHDR